MVLTFQKMIAILCLLSLTKIGHVTGNRVLIDPAVLKIPAVGYLEPQSMILGSAPLIVGGKEATPHAHPHQISLQVYQNGWHHLCGGSIIRNDAILTAAHCVYRQKLPMRVVAGDHNIRLTEGSEQISEVSRAIHHPLYDCTTHDYDYAVVFLAQNLTLNNKVKVIPLPESRTVPSGLCVTTGWGKIVGNKSEEYPDKLYEVELRVVDHASCAKNYSQIDKNVTETMLCASIPLKGTCDGDSGGPLVCSEGSDNLTKKYLAGIVSGGPKSCFEDYLPSIFSNVVRQLDWIREQLEQLEVVNPPSMGTSINHELNFVLYMALTLIYFS